MGKSAIFNQLTGLHQHVSNWPGKTVEKAEGTLTVHGRTVDILDLPGIYSITVQSQDEAVSREFLESGQYEVLVNVVDASALERNLFLTIELLEFSPRMVLALNQVDHAESRGIHIDDVKLSKMIGIPVVPTVGTRGIGLTELMRVVISVASQQSKPRTIVKYTTGIEQRVLRLVNALDGFSITLPLRWVALKLLENDRRVEETVYTQRPEIRSLVQQLKTEIEREYGQDVNSLLVAERYAIASRISRAVTTQVACPKKRTRDFDRVALNPIGGYLMTIAVLGVMFYCIFTIGGILTEILDGAFTSLRAMYDAAFPGPISAQIWSGLIEGVVAGITVVIPYILPFYIALSLLEDSGYLARIAFMMDPLMHKIGFHGKGFIPLMLGFGCNVPACLGCRVLETSRERMICAFAASLVPCSARTIVIAGLVATYVGFGWAMLLYVLDIIVVLSLSRVAFRLLPGETSGLIMDMPCYRQPTARGTLTKAWVNLREFVFVAFPIIIIGNLLIHLANVSGVLDAAQTVMSPVIVLWLGLPAAAGVVLIFGVLRKELTLVMLAAIMGTTNFALVLTPLQMIVFAFVVMLYIPCIATMAALAKETGYRRTALISIIEFILAIVLGGVLFRILTMFGMQ